MMNDILGLLGFRFGSIYVNNLQLRDVFFSEVEETKDITEYAIDGDRNTDLSLHIKYNPKEYTVRGFFQDSDMSDFEVIQELYRAKEPLTLIGTPFDNIDFTMESYRKVDEGYNYLEFEFTLRELILAEIREFTTESRNIPTAKTNNSGVASTKTMNIPQEPY